MVGMVWWWCCGQCRTCILSLHIFFEALEYTLKACICTGQAF